MLERTVDTHDWSSEREQDLDLRREITRRRNKVVENVVLDGPVELSMCRMG